MKIIYLEYFASCRDKLVDMSETEMDQNDIDILSSFWMRIKFSTVKENINIQQKLALQDMWTYCSQRNSINCKNILVPPRIK